MDGVIWIIAAGVLELLMIAVRLTSISQSLHLIATAQQRRLDHIEGQTTREQERLETWL